MITTSYDFSSGSGFVYDASKITFIDDMAQLMLGSLPGQNFVPTISSSTFNSSLLNYSSGSLKQVDQRPATATFYALWGSQLNANWSGSGNGSLVVTPTNGAAINNNVLDLTGSTNKYVTFDATNNMDSLQTLTIEFVLIPNYSGTPSDDQLLLNVSAAQNSDHNLIVIDHFTDGKIYVDFYPSTGGDFALELSTGYNPTMGSPDIFLIQLDATSGTATLFINGVQKSQVTNTPFTRSGPVAYAAVGRYYNGTDTNANFSMSRLSYYSTVVTPASQTLSATIYPAATANLPAFSYSGLGNVVDYNTFTTTDANSVVYTVNGKYFNGSSWVASSGAYLQANSASIVNSNIAALTASNSLQINAIYQPQAVQGSVSSVGVGYIGQSYPMSGPTIKPNNPLTMDELSIFMDVQTAPSNSSVLWYLIIGSSSYWWNGAAWATSDGTHSQSNIAADIQTNAASLPITQGAYVTPVAVLYSSDGLETPSISSLVVTYDYFGPTPMLPAVCVIFGYIYDETQTPVQGAIVTIKNPTTFVNSGIVVAQGQYTAITEANGYFHISLIETETLTDVFYNFSVVYPYATSQNIGTPPNTYIFGPAAVPNSPSANFASLFS